MMISSLHFSHFRQKHYNSSYRVNLRLLLMLLNWVLRLLIICLYNNNNNRISIAPYGRNFRGAGGRSDQCSVKAWLNRKVLSPDLKTVRESLMRIVCGSEFQTVGAEDRKARLEKSVLMNGLFSSGMDAECKVRLQARSAIRRCR